MYRAGFWHGSFFWLIQLCFEEIWVPSQMRVLLSETLSQRHTHTHTRLTALCPGLPGWAGTNLDFTEARDSEWQWHQLDQSAPRSRQITTPAPHRSVFYRPAALLATQPTASKHWRQKLYPKLGTKFLHSLSIIATCHQLSSTKVDAKCDKHTRVLCM